ncbi:glycosyltransferase family 2 protein, partial [Campylobacter jejuni]|nr:glycosyltransferase family 2 protein [Campylobacter jejuni]EAL0791843.1 glycosyltransferase family 2 protein [Campylobacter jejuni]EBF6253000.1 glycosyltransferase family 2 protein [Campylobacter jejuni]ECQ6919353.1 glycosyltransferase family 2 protein [Campylobacter jejuni]
LYPLIFIYSYCEFIFKKKYKPIANNLNKIDNISFAKFNDLLKMVEITISKYIHQYNDAVCLDLNVKEGFLLEELKHYNIKIYGYEYNEYFYFTLIAKYANYNNIFLSKELVINHEISLESLDYTTNDDGYGIYIDDDSLEERKCIFLENIFNKYQHIFILSIYLDFYNYKILSQIFKNEKKILYIICFVDKFFKESEEFKKIYNQFKHKNIFFIDYSEMKNKGKK